MSMGSQEILESCVGLGTNGGELSTVRATYSYGPDRNGTLNGVWN